jgi:hypothetical protein
MESSQQSNSVTPVATAKRSSFSPGSVSFLAGVLLFLMPFVNIKCGDATLKEVRGYELATGFTVQDKKMNQSLFGNMEKEQGVKDTKSEKRDPDMFALAALGLGIIGLIISFKAKSRSIPAAFMGVLASVALIIMMINIKNDQKLEPASNTNNNNVDGFNANFGNDIMRVEFTPWFYITIILFLAAAFFCWRKNVNTMVSTPPE